MTNYFNFADIQWEDEPQAQAPVAPPPAPAAPPQGIPSPGAGRISWEPTPVSAAPAPAPAPAPAATSRNLSNIEWEPAGATQNRAPVAAAGIPAPRRSRSIGDFAKDTAIGLGVGTVNLGRSAVGLADILSGNLAGRGMEAIGYDPEKTVEILESFYSEPMKEARSRVQDAEGFWGTLNAMVDDPSVALQTIIESAPLTLSGMAAARGVATRLLGSALAKNGIASGTKAAQEFAKAYFKSPAVRAAIRAAGGAAEGLTVGGLLQETQREAGKSWGESLPHSLGSAATTGAIAFGSSFIPGLEDAETAIGTAGFGGRKGVLEAGKEIAKTIFKEGVVEELPQEMSEQVWENLALGRPWNEGVGQAGAMGMVAGMGQGGGMAVASTLMDRAGAAAQGATQPPTQEEPGRTEDTTPQPTGNLIDDYNAGHIGVAEVKAVYDKLPDGHPMKFQAEQILNGHMPEEMPVDVHKVVRGQEGPAAGRAYDKVDATGQRYREFVSGGVVDGNEVLIQGRVYPREPSLGTIGTPAGIPAPGVPAPAQPQQQGFQPQAQGIPAAPQAAQGLRRDLAAEEDRFGWEEPLDTARQSAQAFQGQEARTLQQITQGIAQAVGDPQPYIDEAVEFGRRYGLNPQAVNQAVIDGMNMREGGYAPPVRSDEGQVLPGEAAPVGIPAPLGEYVEGEEGRAVRPGAVEGGTDLPLADRQEPEALGATPTPQEAVEAQGEREQAGVGPTERVAETPERMSSDEMADWMERVTGPEAISRDLEFEDGQWYKDGKLAKPEDLQGPTTESENVRKKFAGKTFALQTIDPNEIDVPEGTVTKSDVRELKGKETPPPVIEYAEGKEKPFRKVDGSHRIRAAQERGDESIQVYVPESDFEKYQTQTTPQPTPEAQPEAREAEPKPFPQLALEAAQDTAPWHPDSDKVFISDAYETAKSKGYEGTLDDFKAELIKAHRANELDLVGADLVEAMPKEKVAASRATYLNGEFHFIKRAKAPAVPSAEEIDQAAQEADTEPTPAQIEAGNYKKAHLTWNGLDLSIENPKGSTRSGVDEGGQRWESKLKHHYGYVRRSTGADGDQVDLFMGPQPESDKVFVVDQVNPKTGAFDEHKALLGFPTEQQARMGYLANYQKGWKGLGAITEMSVDEFKGWLREGEQGKPVGEGVGVRAKAPSEAGAAPITIEDYSEKSIAVRGDETVYGGKIRGLKGLYNKNLKGGPGWIIPKRREAEVREALAGLVGEPEKTKAPEGVVPEAIEPANDQPASSSPTVTKVRRTESKSQAKPFGDTQIRHYTLQTALEKGIIDKQEAQAIQGLLDAFPEAYRKHFNVRFSEQEFEPTEAQAKKAGIPAKDREGQRVTAALLTRKIGPAKTDAQHVAVMFQGHDVVDFIHEFAEFAHARLLTTNDRKLVKRLYKADKNRTAAMERNEWFATKFEQWWVRRVPVNGKLQKVFRKLLSGIRNLYGRFKGQGRVPKELEVLFEDIITNGREINERYFYSDEEIVRNYIIGAPPTKAKIQKQGFSGNSKTMISWDPSSLCPKQQNFIDFIAKVVKENGITLEDLASTEVLAGLYDEALAAGVEAPCSYCYVEGARRKAIAFHQAGMGIEGIHAASMAKQIFTTVPYRDAILRWSDKRIKEINQRGGLRLFSFSDYIREAHRAEVDKLLRDAAARGLSIKAITKNPQFVEDFADTGITINLSIDSDRKGKFGVPWDQAAKLKKKHPNVKVRTVAVNMDEVRFFAELEHKGIEDFVDVITPYHHEGEGDVPEGYQDMAYGKKDGKELQRYVTENDLEKRFCCLVGGKCFSEKHQKQYAANCGLKAGGLSIPKVEGPPTGKARLMLAALESPPTEGRFRLVGSRGRGEAREDSDYDWVTDLTPKENEEFHKGLAHLPEDVKEFYRKWKNKGEIFFAAKAVNGTKFLYQVIGRPSRPRAHRVTGPINNIYYGLPKGEVKGSRSALDQIDTPSGPRFSTGTRPKTPIPRANLDRLVGRMMKHFPGLPKVFVVEAQEELPLEDFSREEREAIESGESIVYGMITAGDSIYLVRENIGTQTEAIRAVFHEGRGHYAVREFLSGEDFEGLTDYVWDTYGEEGLAEVIDRYDLDPANVEDQRVAAEEYIAQIAEDGSDPGLMRRVIAAVKRFLKKVGLHFNLTDDDIRGIIAGASRKTLERAPEGGRPVDPRELEFAQDPRLFLRQAADKIRGLEAFKRWFGKSKIREDRKPLVMYRGTARGASLRGKKGGSVLGDLLYFSSDPEYAEMYATARGGRNASLMPVFLSVENPLVWDQSKLLAQQPSDVRTWKSLPDNQKTAFLKRKGYDGVVWRTKANPFHEVAVLDQGQVKSIYNRGTWDRTKGDTRLMVAGKDFTGTPEFKERFGESQIVDRKKNPMLVYHGTPEGEFDEFAPDKYGYIFFTPDEDYAQGYAENVDRSPQAAGWEPTTRGYYLSAQNVLDLSEMPEYEEMADASPDLANLIDDHFGFDAIRDGEVNIAEFTKDREVRDALKAAGYDGVRGMVNITEGITAVPVEEIAVLEPSQVILAPHQEEGAREMPEGTTAWHGTTAPSDEIKPGVMYLSPDKENAQLFAENPILSGERGGKPRIRKFSLGSGRIKEINDAVEEEVMEGGDVDALIEREARRARQEGYRYLQFWHPGVDEDFRVTVSLYPDEDIGVDGKTPSPRLMRGPSKDESLDAWAKDYIAKAVAEADNSDSETVKAYRKSTKPRDLSREPLEPDKKKRVRALRDDLSAKDGSFLHDTIIGMKGVVERRGKGWVGTKDDLSVFDVTLGLPSHSIDKVPAWRRVFEWALGARDIKNEINQQLMQDPATGIPTTELGKALQKANRVTYDAVGRELVENDIQEKGYRVFEEDDGTWRAMTKNPVTFISTHRTEGEAKKRASVHQEAHPNYTFEVREGDKPEEWHVVRRVKGKAIGTFGAEEEAWAAAREHEAEQFRDKYGDLAADAVRAGRGTTDRGFLLLTKNLRDLLARKEAEGLEPTIETVKVDGSKVTIDIREALAMMGDLRGHYFPRVRKAGDYLVYSRSPKEGEPLEMRKFTTKAGADAYEAKQIKKGYETWKKRSDALPEDVWELFRKTVGIQEIVTEALNRLQADNLRLEDFGLQFTDRYIGERKRRDFAVFGPTSKEMREVMKDLGGKFYSPTPGEPRGWHFENPGRNFENRLAKALAAKVDIVDRQITSLFAESVATSLSGIIKEHGHRSHMIRRRQNLVTGYETDFQQAYARYASGIGSGQAKAQMSMGLVRAGTGTDVSWQDFRGLVASIQQDEALEDYAAFEDENYDLDISPEEHRVLVSVAQKEGDLDYLDYRSFILLRRIDPSQQPNAFRAYKKLSETMLRNQESAERVVGFFKGLAVFKYLAFRVFSAPLINLTAIPTSATASMSTYADVPLSKSLGYITRGVREYVRFRRGKTDNMDPALLQLFKDMQAKGWDNPQFNQEAFGVLQNQVGRAWGKLIETGMWTFGASETLNRAATISGAYMALQDQAKKKGERFHHEKAMALAKKISDRGHGIYDKSNKPMVIMGSGYPEQIGQAYFMYRTFAYNYLLTMKDAGFRLGPLKVGRGENKAFGWMLAAPALLAGAGASAAMPLISAIVKALTDSDDPEEEFYDWLLREVGAPAERAARFGLFGMAGVSLKGSLELGILDVPTKPADLLGAPGSVVGDVYDGVKRLTRGDVLKGTEQLLPLGFAAPIKAFRERTQGLTTRSNAPLFYGTEPVKLTGWETALRTLAFNPARIAGIREEQWRETLTGSEYRRKKSDIYSRIRKYHLLPPKERTKERWGEIAAMIDEYNARVMKTGADQRGIAQYITRESIRQSMRRAFRPSKRERLRATQ